MDALLSWNCSAGGGVGRGTGGPSEEQARKCNLITSSVSYPHLSDTAFAFYFDMVNQNTTRHGQYICRAFLFAREALTSCAVRFFFPVQQLTNL